MTGLQTTDRRDLPDSLPKVRPLLSVVKYAGTRAVTGSSASDPRAPNVGPDTTLGPRLGAGECSRPLAIHPRPRAGPPETHHSSGVSVLLSLNGNGAYLTFPRHAPQSQCIDVTPSLLGRCIWSSYGRKIARAGGERKGGMAMAATACPCAHHGGLTPDQGAKNEGCGKPFVP